VNLEFTKTKALGPGDIRTLGPGDLVILRPSVKERPDFMSIAPALLIAVIRGASVIWEDE
jgi:hypothetical protein